MTVDILLGGNNALLEELAFRGEVQSIVEDLGVVEGEELITKSANLAVEDETFEVNVGAAETSETWGLVASAGLETNCIVSASSEVSPSDNEYLTETVLNNIDTSNTVSAGNSVDLFEKIESAKSHLKGGVT